MLINHADGQFDAYNFLFSNMEYILNKSIAIMPQRLGRPFFEDACSAFLRFALSLINLKRIKDFNGQPKIFKKSAIKNISELPNDYCIDYSLYKIFEDNSNLLPVLQRDRKLGTSSWKSKFLSWIFIFSRYIIFAFIFNKDLFRK